MQRELKKNKDHNKLHEKVRIKVVEEGESAFTEGLGDSLFDYKVKIHFLTVVYLIRDHP
jgi:hypothetical protein